MIAPDEALHLLRLLGLNLVVNDGRLNVSPAELIDGDTRWLIRKHRDAIITALEQDDAPRWAWLACFGAHYLLTVHSAAKSITGVQFMRLPIWNVKMEVALPKTPGSKILRGRDSHMPTLCSVRHSIIISINVQP